MVCTNYYHIRIVCTNYCYYHQKMSLKNFGLFNIKNECISTLVSSYRVAASFITSKFLEHNTENEKFEKSRVLQKCPLMHITLIIIKIIVFKRHLNIYSVLKFISKIT